MAVLISAARPDAVAAKTSHGETEPERSGRPTDEQRLREDRALFERLADERDPVDREILVQRFLPLARSLAQRYVRSGEAFDDVFQVACIGLINAIDRYDVSRGRAFSSFAVPTISGEIKRYYRDRTWAVHVPRDLQDRVLALDGAARELEAVLGHQPTVAELADHLGLEDEDVLDTLHAAHARRADSLDVPYGEDDPATLGDTIASHDDGFHRAEQREALARLTAVLPPRDRRILALRFQHDLTQQEIGELVGLSQMQISRILRQAITKLRDHAAAEHSRGQAA
jgi:RNA polymerase sigma-B factor